MSALSHYTAMYAVCTRHRLLLLVYMPPPAAARLVAPGLASGLFMCGALLSHLLPPSPETGSGEGGVAIAVSWCLIYSPMAIAHQLAGPLRLWGDRGGSSRGWEGRLHSRSAPDIGAMSNETHSHLGRCCLLLSSLVRASVLGVELGDRPNQYCYC